MWDHKKSSVSITDSSGQSQGQSHGAKYVEKIDTDSGFLSGQNLQFSSEQFPSEEDLSKPASAENEPKILVEQQLDSGLVEDCEELPMFLPHNIDEGISVRFCNLNLICKDQINNLDRKLPKENEQKKKNVSKAPWEMYYHQNEDGDTQLHIAIILKIKEVVCALIRLAPHPCLYDIQNDISQSALHLAVMTNQPKIVRELVIAGAKLNMRDYNGNTALHLACLSGESECAKELLTPLNADEEIKCKSLNINVPQDMEQWNYDGERCVHLAAKNSHIKILRYLIDAGADINAREGKSGLTPLHLAIEQGNEELANFLLDECPKLSLETVTYAGLTAYQLAAIQQHRNLLENLSSKGAEALTPPESEEEESDSEDEQIAQYYGATNNVFTTLNGPSTIHVA